MKAKGICLILLSLVIVTSLIWCFKKIQNESFQAPSIYFLDENAARNFLYSDHDGYLANLTQANLHALDAATKEDLLAKWIHSCDPFSHHEQEKLRQAVEIVEHSCGTNIKDEVFRKQLQKIPWQFAKTIFPYYLDGLPHTRGDIIWLTDKVIATSDVERLAKLLMHEKTHIWERKFPKAMSAWMQSQGYAPVGKTIDDVLYRQNPDVNDTIYVDKHNRKMHVRFKHAKPSGLGDVEYTLNYTQEHPYEALAYKMETFVTTE